MLVIEGIGNKNCEILRIIKNETKINNDFKFLLVAEEEINIEAEVDKTIISKEELFNNPSIELFNHYNCICLCFNIGEGLLEHYYQLEKNINKNIIITVANNKKTNIYRYEV